MRIPAVVAAATALTLGLGATVAIGLTAAADPPPSWTVDITSAPLLPDGELTFTGTKPSESVPTGVTVTTGTLTESASCTGLDGTDFSCSYDPAGDFTVGSGTISFLIGEGADFTVDFTVDGPAAPATGAPSMSYEYTPAGVIASGTPTSPASKVAIEFFRYTGNEADQWEAAGGCPAPGYDGNPFDAVTDNTCSLSDLAPGIYNPYSQQDNGDGSTSTGVFASDYFVVPPAPTISAEINGNYSAFLSGTVPAGFALDAPDECTSEPYFYNDEWWCYTEPLGIGSHTFSAQAYDDGGNSTEAISDEDATYRPGGRSAVATTDLTVTTMTPAVELSFIPGGVTVGSTPQDLGSIARTDLYQRVEYDYYYSSYYYWEWADDCGGPEPSDGEGGPYWEGDPFEGISPELTNFGCTFSELSPGAWSVESRQDDGEGGLSEATDSRYFVVPVAPVMASTSVTGGGSITVSGTSGPGDKVYVLNGAAQILCSTTSNPETGLWSCTTPALPNGGYDLRAYSEDIGAGEVKLDSDSTYVTGGLSDLSGLRVVTVDVPALPGTGGTPAGPTTPTLITPTWFFSLGGVDLGNLHPGDKFTITGSGLPAGSKITAELHSTPVTLGTATVGSNGTFSLSATVPESTEPGDHTVVVSVTGDGLAPTTKEQPVHVNAESETAGHTAEGSGTAAEGEAHGEAHGAADAEHSATAPNILTNSMNPIIEVLSDPERIPAAFAAGLVLIIFAILPAHLLNSTIAEQYERFARRMPALRSAPKWYTSLSAALAKAPALGGILLMAATGFLFAFADPHFGFNLHSLRLIIALSAALFVVFFVANWITAAIMRRVWDVDVVVRLRPLGLILTVVGVIVSRILEFSPGFLVGVVLGLSIASSAAAEHAWKAVLIRASVVTGFGIASWMVYSSIAEGVHHDPTFLNEVVLEFFVAIATEGIVLLLVELLPLHMLEGERLYKKSKVLWGAVYTVVLVVFILAVVPWEGNWRELGESFWPWFTAVAIFGAACVSIYLYFRFIATPLHHDEHNDDSGPELEDDERIAVGNDS